MISNQSYFFFIVNSWPAFKAKGLYMEGNEVVSTSFGKSVLNICLIKAQKSNLYMQ